MKKYAQPKKYIFILLLYFSITARATNYYIDNINGNDSYSGLTPTTAWQTLTKVNAFVYLPGDSILFKRGGQWRGQLLPQSGTANGYITYADYGSGVKPQLLGSVNISAATDWISEGNNIWHTVATSSVDVGNLIFNNAANFGVKKWTASQLLNQGDFWWDKAGTNTVKMYSSINPANYYTNIEAALGKFIVLMQADSFVVLKNMSFKYGAADGIEVRNTHHVFIRDCELSYIGGTELTTQVRYGGAIQFWANSHDNTVERCKIWEIYDDAVTNQGNVSAGGTVQQYNLFYRNNIIWNCSESSFCYCIQPNIISGSFMKNIYFENNTCVNAGGGWAASQRPDLKGFQIYCSSNTAVTDSVFIRNNIFYKSRCVLFIDNSAVHTLSFTTMDYNCWYTQNMSDTIAALWTSSSLTVWKASQFSNFQTTNNKEVHSIMSDPLFVNAAVNDYHLTSNSPCINAGTNTNISSDFDLTPVPQNGAYQIGALAYKIATAVANITTDPFRALVYPNPGNGNFFIQTTEPVNEIKIYNLSGSVIYQTSINNYQQNIDISSQPNGIYFIQFQKRNHFNFIKKLIINK